MNARAAAEASHRVAHRRLDECVDDDRRAAAGAADRELEILDRLDARVSDLLELLLRELCLERQDQPTGGLAGRVRDDMQLDVRSRSTARRVSAPTRLESRNCRDGTA